MSLPSGYKRLEYIQSSGTQYIDTGFKHNQDTRIAMSAYLDAVDASSAVWPFGARNSSSSATMGLFCLATGSWGADYNGNSQRYTFGSSSPTLSIDYNKNVLTFNGVTHTFNAGTFQCNSNLVLLAVNTGGTVSGQISAKLYSCQIYDNGTLVRDFVPCIKDDGEVGLYDLVGKQFYGNAGTGTFTAGPVMEPPEAPTNLQHLLAIRLAWSAVDGATGYNVYRDDALLASTTETTFIDLTAEENTEYTYAVSAVGTGGESAKTTLTVYTKSGYFLYKPYVESATFQ